MPSGVTVVLLLLFTVHARNLFVMAAAAIRFCIINLEIRNDNNNNNNSRLIKGAISCMLSGSPER